MPQMLSRPEFPKGTTRASPGQACGIGRVCGHGAFHTLLEEQARTLLAHPQQALPLPAQPSARGVRQQELVAWAQAAAAIRVRVAVAGLLEAARDCGREGLRLFESGLAIRTAH